MGYSHAVAKSRTHLSTEGPSVYPSGLSRETEPTHLQAHTVLSRFSCVRLFVTLWTAACHAPLSMGSSRQEHWSRLPCPPPGDLPDPGIKPVSLPSPGLAGGPLTTSATRGEVLQELAHAATETEKSRHLLSVSWRPGVTHSDSKGLRPGALMSKGWRRWTAQLRWNQGKELAALLNMCVCKHARSCLTLQPHGLQPARLFCPLDFPGKNTGVGYQFLLQGLLPTQGSNPRLMSPALAGAFFTINATCEAPQTA